MQELANISVLHLRVDQSERCLDKDPKRRISGMDHRSWQFPPDTIPALKRARVGRVDVYRLDLQVQAPVSPRIMAKT